MKLSSLLRENLVFFGDSLRTKRQVIDFLLDAICRSDSAHPDRALLLESVLERESRGGTSLSAGVAIPHGRIDGFDDCLIAIYVPRKPIEEADMTLRMIVLILTSKQGSSLYLKTLAAVAKLARDQGLFASLTGASSPARFIEILEKAKLEVDRPPVVGDLMERDVQGLTPATTVRELIDLFQKNGKSWAAVTGFGGEFLGEVSLFEVMAKAMPNYSTYMENLSFMSALRPLETLLERESEIPVSALAVRPPVVLSPGESVIEAAFELVRHRRDSAPVIEKGKIVGILGLEDVLLGYLRG